MYDETTYEGAGEGAGTAAVITSNHPDALTSNMTEAPDFREGVKSFLKKAPARV